MSLAAQAKVLRVLQDGVVTRIGGAKPVSVDVRVLAATNKKLEEEIAAGRFREDLFYRLHVVPIHVPPLRERREDIPLLIAHFSAVLTKHEGVPPRTFAPEAVARLSGLDWPGNVRELRNTIERLLILAAGPVITLEDVDRLVGGVDGDPGTAAMGAAMQCRTFDEFRQAAERRLPARQAARIRLERFGDGARAQDAAVESVQEAGTVRAEPRSGGLSPTTQGATVADRDWSKELAKIDKQLQGMPDEELAPARTPDARGHASSPGGSPGGRPPAPAPEKPARSTGGFGVFARLSLSVVLGVAMVLWPYESRCGFGLAAYLAAVTVVAVSGAWSAVWTWRHRAARAHVLSLLILLWGLVLGSMEVLPRVGYAKADLRHPAGWMCK